MLNVYYSFWESWAQASSLISSLSWKMGTLSAHVTAEFCLNLTLLCIDNQHYATIYISVSSVKMD